MIINYISIKNFRQFKDIQDIVFSTSKEENITLIQGDNTSGKTTLLQAFLWCLYGEANFKSKDSLINTLIASEMLESGKDNEVKIAIELEHHGLVYNISRSLIHTIRHKEVKAASISIVEMSFKQADGQTKKIPPHDVVDKIKEILPQDLSSYFLYDTERFGNITTKSDVTEAVKGILGLTVLENTISHIGKDTQSKTLLGKLNASLNLEGNKIANDALIKMQEAQEKITQLENRKKEKTKELEHYYNSKKQKEDILRSFAESAKLQQERDVKESELKYEENYLQDAYSHFQSSFNTNTFMFLAKPLMFQALEELKNANVDDKGIKDMNANSIRDIIKRTKCVCGTVIKEDTEAYNHLIHELQYLPPESIGNLIRNFKEKTQTFINASSSYSENVKTSYKSIIRTQGKIMSITDQIDYIKSKITTKESVKMHQENLNEIENNIKSNENLLLDIEKQIGGQDQIIKVNKNEHAKNIGASEKNKEILTYMSYARELLIWIENKYNLRENEIKIKLEEKVNGYFNQIYHGERKVKIDDKYKVTLITNSGDQEIITDESQGLETVKNFAFISGLVDLAKEKLTSKDSLENDAEEYPLILDAPFSNADERHVENISKVLPEVANQLILIVMSKDWNYAEKTMKHKVGKRYQLDKKSEVLTEIKEVVGVLNV